MNDDRWRLYVPFTDFLVRVEGYGRAAQSQFLDMLEDNGVAPRVVDATRALIRAIEEAEY